MKNLIREIHRRSLWQVLGVYLAGSWVALQVVEQLTEAAGLPDWVRPFSLVLLILGFPIVMATAIVQEGVGGGDGAAAEDAPLDETGSTATAGREAVVQAGAADRGSSPGAHRRIFTWRNAVMGGVGAFALMGLFVLGYFVMRATGVGPAASLVAKGVIEEGDPVLLAEFRNTSDDPALGGIVTEALRVDLGGTNAVTVVEPGRIRDALTRMGRDPDEPVTPEVAYEIAVREGIKAVIEGEVGSAGSGYILVATIGAAESGAPLATFRRTAGSPDEVISAIDALSQDIREKAGESLRSIRAEEPLHAVTTASLEALRKYAAAEEAELRGEHVRMKALLEEALELDPEFAMAWRRLAVATQDAGGTRAEAMEAATRAYELRHRLTDRERYLATAYYHNEVTGNSDEQIRAYRAVLEEHPDDPVALNNLSIALANRTRYDEANELLERAISGPGTSNSAYVNLAFNRASAGDVEGARGVLELIGTRDVWYSFLRFAIASVAGEWDQAHEAAEELVALPEAPPGWRHSGRVLPVVPDVARGRLAEAREHVERAIGAAEAAGRPQDVVDARLWLADAEWLAHAGSLDPTRAALRRLARSGELAATPDSELDFDRLAVAYARAGLTDEARSALEAWDEAGGHTSGVAGRAIADVRLEVDALLEAREDPAVGARALLDLRSRRDCPHCYAWEIAEAHARAGEPGLAVEEYERARSISGEVRIWFGPKRILGQERLARLYDELGEVERAVEHYRSFADAWADADPELQDRVGAARARLEELAATAGRGSGSEGM